MLGDKVYTKLRPGVKIEGFMNAVRTTTKDRIDTVFADRSSTVKYSKRLIELGHDNH
jgi:hypothetical protein